MTEATRKVVLRLKEVREQKGLTYREIEDICERNGEYVSRGSIRRVFEKGSEDRPSEFRTATIERIFHAVIGLEDTALTPAEEETLNDLGRELATENAALKALLELREAEIADLQEQLTSLKKELDGRSELVYVLEIKIATMQEMFDRAIEAMGRANQ